jgi:hypothetical protein
MCVCVCVCVCVGGGREVVRPENGKIESEILCFTHEMRLDYYSGF